jgi:hypothetical protein
VTEIATEINADIVTLKPHLPDDPWQLEPASHAGADREPARRAPPRCSVLKHSINVGMTFEQRCGPWAHKDIEPTRPERASEGFEDSGGHHGVTNVVTAN